MEYKLLIALVLFIMTLVMSLIIMFIAQQIMISREIKNRERVDLLEMLDQKIAVADSVVSSKVTGKMSDCFLEGQNRYKQKIKEMCLSERKNPDCSYGKLSVDNIRKLSIILEEIITKDIECQSNYGSK